MAPHHIQNRNNSKNKKNYYKKNFGSVAKGHALPDQHKKKIVRRYMQKKKKFEGKSAEESTNKPSSSNLPLKFQNLAQIEEEEDKANDMEEPNEPERQPFENPWVKARRKYEEIQKEREEARERAQQERKEAEKRRKEARANRQRRNKLLMMKTPKGQPLMKAQMQVLLENIEKVVGKKS